MSLKVKIGVGMLLIAFLVGLISAFMNSLIAGFAYVGMLAWMSLSTLLVFKG